MYQRKIKEERELKNGRQKLFAVLYRAVKKCLTEKVTSEQNPKIKLKAVKGISKNILGKSIQQEKCKSKLQ